MRAGCSPFGPCPTHLQYECVQTAHHLNAAEHVVRPQQRHLPTRHAGTSNRCSVGGCWSESSGSSSSRVNEWLGDTAMHLGRCTSGHLQHRPAPAAAARLSTRTRGTIRRQQQCPLPHNIPPPTPLPPQPPPPRCYCQPAPPLLLPERTHTATASQQPQHRALPLASHSYPTPRQPAPRSPAPPPPLTPLPLCSAKSCDPHLLPLLLQARAVAAPLPPRPLQPLRPPVALQQLHRQRCRSGCQPRELGL